MRFPEDIMAQFGKVFFAYLDVPEDESKCWTLTGLRPNGRGYFGITAGIKGETYHLRAHQFSAWYFKYIYQKPGDFICHTCDNRTCVNPAHLYLGDVRTNWKDMRERNPHWVKKRKKHCIHGHKWDLQYTDKNGQFKQKCYTCQKRYNKIRQANKLARKTLAELELE